MFIPFVTTEHPIALYEGAPPQYTSDGLAIDCALILHVKKGTARVNCNLAVIEEKPGSVVLFHPGDAIKVEQRSGDYEVEILAVSSFIQLAALNQLEYISSDTLKRNYVLNTPEVSSAAEGLVKMLGPAINVCSPRELYLIGVMQLRAFYSFYHVLLRREGQLSDAFKSHSDELFFRFRKLLGEHCRESRSVAYYAGKLNITTRYLTNVVKSHYGRSPKEAIDTYTLMQLRLDLLQDDTPISELADRYNFSSPAHLTDYFVRLTGQTPHKYRKVQ